MTKKKDSIFEIRIRLQSHNKTNLDGLKKDIELFAMDNKIKYSSINLPVEKKKITILKSPHVNKKARDQFEIVFLSRLIILKGFLHLSCYSKLQKMGNEDVSMKLFVSPQ
jgi:small subunit ribosomal protein S10